MFSLSAEATVPPEPEYDDKPGLKINKREVPEVYSSGMLKSPCTYENSKGGYHNHNLAYLYEYLKTKDVS